MYIKGNHGFNIIIEGYRNTRDDLARGRGREGEGRGGGRGRGTRQYEMEYHTSEQLALPNPGTFIEREQEKKGGL